MARDGGGATTRARARLLGVSNVSLEQLEADGGSARDAPAFVQNRCYAPDRLGPRRARVLLRANGIVYQGFSLLTANPRGAAPRPSPDAARPHRRTPAQVVFRFALAVGMIPLTGTTDRAHMREDLASRSVSLSHDEVRAIESLAGSQRAGRRALTLSE